MRVLVVDNYDSFVHTIVGYLEEIGASTLVKRNNEVNPTEVNEYDGVIISPGPGSPAQAGASEDIIRRCAEIHKPMLGVCLGHQAIAEVFGAKVSHAPTLMHGKTSIVHHNQSGIYTNIPSPVQVTRYHSIAVEPQTLPAEIIVTGWTEDKIVMSLEHTDLPLWGVQFHPESIMTEHGHTMIRNWLTLLANQ